MGVLATIRARAALMLANVAHRMSPGVLKRAPRVLSGVDDSRGWWSLFSGLRHLTFQTEKVVVNQDSVLAQATVFACITLIASDIGKLRAKLVEFTSGIWEEVKSAAFSPVLKKPNAWQTWQKFIEQWMYSLLTWGNTYVLKVRDQRNVVVAMYVLDPTRCRPLVAQDGSVYYALQEDDLSQVFEHVPALPASEIIHDRINCLFHPLVGLSPIFACGLSATKGLRINENAAKFFENQSQPGGVLTAPAEISDETAQRLKEYFETRFTGENAGKVAVLGDGLKYEPMTTNAVDAQLIEQLQWTAREIAAAFKVPGYLVGAEPVPPNNNIEALRLDYYMRCLQTLIEGIENGLDDGLGLLEPKEGKQLGVELDLDSLMRMDSKTLSDVEGMKAQRGISSPNESRRKFNLPPVKGGDTPFLQEQNWPIAQLAARDLPARPITPPAQIEPPDAQAANDDKALSPAVVKALASLAMREALYG